MSQGGRAPTMTGDLGVSKAALHAAPGAAAERVVDPATDCGSVDDPVVCFCNEVPLSAIVTALEQGANDLTRLIDATWAGCGPCGGTCQPDLEAILRDWYAEDPDEP